MPYIEEEEAAQRVSVNIQPVPGDAHATFTYAITEACVQYIENVCGGVSFLSLSEVDSALASAKAEIDRRLRAPYEAAKAIEPGRVDPFDRLQGFDRVKNSP